MEKLQNTHAHICVEGPHNAHGNGQQQQAEEERLHAHDATGECGSEKFSKDFKQIL